jgi:hypothetical protein
MKLIAVGMRFCDTNAVSYAVKCFNRGDNKVQIKQEDNPNGVSGIAYGVWFTGSKIAYIRNADLASYKKELLYTSSAVVKKVTPNYILLEAGIEESKYSIDPSVYSEAPVKINNHNTICAPISERKETKMNMNSMRDNFFRELKNVVIDIQSGKFGFQSADGIAVYDNGTISVNPITELGVKVPAFAMRVAVADLNEGDIIVSGSENVFFKGKTETGYEVVTVAGEVRTVGNVSNMFFGKNTVLAVKNMFASGAGGMNPMMLAMMMGDDKGGKFDMKTFALMSMMGGGAMDSNMLMMAMLMDK